jgi:hypothetical protein
MTVITTPAASSASFDEISCEVDLKNNNKTTTITSSTTENINNNNNTNNNADIDLSLLSTVHVCAAQVRRSLFFTFFFYHFTLQIFVVVNIINF